MDVVIYLFTGFLISSYRVSFCVISIGSFDDIICLFCYQSISLLGGSILLWNHCIAFISQTNKTSFILCICVCFSEKCPPGGLIIDKIANLKTPLHHALLLNNIVITELLLTHGADIYQPLDDGNLVCTPLQYVSRNSSEEMLRMILQHGVIDLDDVARREAEANGKEEVVQILLNNGRYLYLLVL